MTSIDNETKGFDLDLIKKVNSISTTPIISSGGEEVWMTIKLINEVGTDGATFQIFCKKY